LEEEKKMKIIATVVFIRFQSFDFSTGNDFLTINHINHPRKCENHCAVNEKCKGYVFSRNQKKCWLKDNLNGFRAVNNDEKIGIKVID
jgi:hypothetical protein